MSDRGPLEERVWEVGWEGHRVAQRRRLASLTLIEKLAWLESAQKLVESLAQSRRDARDGAGRRGEDATESANDPPTHEDRA